MKGMRFSTELAAFLKEHGYIYTVRKFRYNLNDSIIQVQGVGTCQRAQLGQVTSKKNLEEFVSMSGFKNAEDWWKRIKELNKGYVGPFYVYEVVKEDDGQQSDCS